MRKTTTILNTRLSKIKKFAYHSCTYKFHPVIISEPSAKNGIKTNARLQYISDDTSHKRVILNFVKGVAQNKFPGIRLNEYSLLTEFLKNYDTNIKIISPNFCYYKRVDAKFSLFSLNEKVSSFIAYVKHQYPHFSEE